MNELEITESQFIKEKSTITKHLSFKQRTASGQINDFGNVFFLPTIYLVGSTIKIDQVFVGDMRNLKKDWQILKRTHRAGKILGLTVIAEELNKSSKNDNLLSLGCGEWTKAFISNRFLRIQNDSISPCNLLLCGFSNGKTIIAGGWLSRLYLYCVLTGGGSGLLDNKTSHSGGMNLNLSRQSRMFSREMGTSVVLPLLWRNALMRD